MNKVKFYWMYAHCFNLDIYTEKNIEVYIDEFPDVPMPIDVIRIVVIQEPTGVHPHPEVFALLNKHQDWYNYLFTHNEDMLTSNPKARLFIGSCTWVHNYIPIQKKFSVSALIGGKNKPIMEGYALRHNLWKVKEQITIPIDFYLSSHCRFLGADYTINKVLGNSKFPLYDSQFHITIENTSMNNLIANRLIDCFQTKTVPIFYGCPNVGNYFNIEGIIMVRNLEEIISACNKLTPQTYDSMLPAIEDNYNRSHTWCSFEKIMENAILQLI
jgi:hypothetical protein